MQGSPHGRHFWFTLPPPSRNSSLASYFASKILVFKIPLPLGLMTFHGVGMDFFLELHNIGNVCETDIKITIIYLYNVYLLPLYLYISLLDEFRVMLKLVLH